MKIFLFILVQSFVLLNLLHFNLAGTDHEISQQRPKRTYIIHMDKSNKPAVFDDHVNWYDSSLKSVSDSAEMLYTYENVIHGFATRITEEEAHLLNNQPGVVSVIPETRYELHTTRTPDFLGLKKSYSLIAASDKASDVIIGVLDTGVWPEIESYDDKGLGPVPKSWKGKCEAGKNFNSSSCNRKLIGARFFYKGYEKEAGRIDEKVESKSPRDDDGHGTHTSTTAAGSPVSSASVLGYASGTARGMAPTARVATYKVCWLKGCFDSDLIAGFDKAIADGVHILSMSLGGGSGTEYHSDILAIATFAATARGILVSASAGNSGPYRGSVFNVAPWITTVGAGTIDRDFPAYVKLGNGQEYKGVSLYKGKQLSDKVLVPIVYGASVSNDSDGDFCLPGSLIPKKTKGKIVICFHGRNGRVQAGLAVKDAGGIGMIYTRDDDSRGEELVADAHLLPAAFVSLEKGLEIRRYVDSVANPTATIIQGATKLGVQPSPIVASFSSRGPNRHTPEILKPDLIAPGVNILAGWTGAVGPSGLSLDKRRVNFNIISGTSMSCPHVSGLAALLKAAHPKWSPAAIRSALMTTAYSTYKNGKTIEDVVTARAATPFDFGAGHVDPVAALDPGLVYDATVEDYINFLCALDYAPEQIKTVTKRDFTCNSTKKYSVRDLNYPSFAVPLKAESEEEVGATKNVSQTMTYTRTLTNVGAPAKYEVSVSKIDSVKILVKPKSLSFNEAYEKKTYTVTFVASTLQWGTERFGRLEWSDGKHIVGSPIAFSWSE